MCIDNLSLKIYLNHTLSSWGDRMWDFAVGLYLVILFPKSLLLTATLGFSICLSVIIFGSHLGKWIDQSKRLVVANQSLLFQNAFVILGSIVLSVNIYFQADIQEIWSGNLQNLLYFLIIVIAVVANLASVVSDIAIEKDWVVILTKGDDKKLATMNATMRTIDLTTNVLAPLVLGQIITFGSQLSGTIFIACWNFVSAIVEYRLLSDIYKAVPQLSNKTTISERNLTSFWEDVSESWQGWKKYFKHPIRFAGIAFAMLFMTVMGFDSITLGYIYSQGGSESLIGLVTGISAIFGILGSLTFPVARERIGKYSTANCGFGLNVLFLSLCVGSVFGPGSPFEFQSILQPFANSNAVTITKENKTIPQLWNENSNIFYFILGIILARFGLWMADLSVTQIFQERVEESQRGLINGVQNSLNQFANLFKFFLVILFPSSQAFGYLIFLSFICMIIAWIFFIIFSLTDQTISQYANVDERTKLLEQPKQPKTKFKYTNL